MDFYLKYEKEKIKLADKAFAGGGEGNLYKILSPRKYKGYVAKIYHPLKRTDQRAQKIDYLHQHPPEGLVKGQHPAYIWVTDVLLDRKKNFMGFIMPFVRGEKLEVLCSTKLSKKLDSAWKRFDLRDPKALGLRLRLCFNLAAAVYHVHSTGRYVIVDLKPENVLIQPNGLVSLVDMDSVEVVENDRVVFQAPVATPEYTPPEHYSKKSRLHEEDAIDVSWDSFALATIFYKLLFGIHPYAASAKAPYDQMVSLHQKIQHGLFVQHPQADKVLNIIPPPHQKFKQLDKELQKLFKLSFVEGHQDPNIRPLAEEWCMALLNSFGDEKMKQHFKDLLLLKGSTGKMLRRPSKLVEIPELQLKEEELLPADYHSLLKWNSPQPKGMIPSNRMKIKHSIDDSSNHRFSALFSMVFLFLILSISNNFRAWLSTKMWEATIFQATITVLILLTIPFFVVPLFIYLFQLLFNQRVKAWRKAKKLFRTEVKELKKTQKLFTQVRTKLQEQIAQELPKMDSLKAEAKKLQEAFKNWLTQKDQEAEALIAEEKKLIVSVQAPFIQEILEQLPFSIQSPKDGRITLDYIQKAIQSKKQQEIRALEQERYDQKLVSNNPEVRKFIDEEIKKTEWERQQYLKAWDERRALLLVQEKHDQKALAESLKEEANIRQKYDHYLSHISNKRRIALKLTEAGVKSILQIERIDHLRAQLELKNGQVLLLDQITDAAIALASKLGDWFIEIRKLKKEQKDELLRIERFYNQERKSMQKQKMDRLAAYKEALDDLKKKAELAYKRIKIRALIEKDEDYAIRLKEIKQRYTEKLKIASSEFKEKYEQLTEEVKAEQTVQEAKLRQLEEDFKEKSLEQLKQEPIEKIRLDSLEKMKLIQQKAKKVQDAETILLKYKS